jgi:hypothetical protein
MVPRAGIEPARDIVPRDFKSLASTKFRHPGALWLTAESPWRKAEYRWSFKYRKDSADSSENRSCEFESSFVHEGEAGVDRVSVVEDSALGGNFVKGAVEAP